MIPKKSASAANPSTFHPGFAENAAEKAGGTKVQKEWGSCHPCHPPNQASTSVAYPVPEATAA